MIRAHVLLTSVGGLGVPAIVEALRSEPSLDLTVTGVDARPDPVGGHFVECCERVPTPDAPGYVDAILDLCRRRRVDVVIPQSDGEAVRLSQAESRFHAAGCILLASSPGSTRTACDKYECFRHLKARGVPVPDTIRPGTLAEVPAALERLGFPKKPVVLKPLGASGGRGFRLVSGDFDELGHLLTAKQERLLRSERLLQLLERAPQFPEFLLMEHLDGDSFTVDVLVRNGRAACVIPQQRIAPRYGSIEVGVVAPVADIDRLVERILEALPLRYLVNMDMAFRRAPRRDGVFVFDVNPRPSACLGATHAAGSFLLIEAVLDALGRSRPVAPFRPTKTMRYWNHTCTPWEQA